MLSKLLVDLYSVMHVTVILFINWLSELQILYFSCGFLLKFGCLVLNESQNELKVSDYQM